MFNLSEAKIAVIGLGYVGLPLSVHFNREFELIGYDINSNRIEGIKNSIMEFFS